MPNIQNQMFVSEELLNIGMIKFSEPRFCIEFETNKDMNVKDIWLGLSF